MTTTAHYQLLVVGGGKAGKTLAMDRARAGWRVAMVEQAPEMIGGTCINLACIPTKTLIRCAEVAQLARRAADFGVDATLRGTPAEAVRERTRAVVESMRAMNLDQFTASGMDLVMGRARFVAPRRVVVASNDRPLVLEGEHVVINLGTRPALPGIPGLADAVPLTSESLLELERIPAHLVVMGGGYVGVEFAQAMRRLGSRVTLVQRGPQLLAREDADVADAVAAILRDDGVDVLLHSEVTAVERRADGTVRLALRSDGGPDEIEADDVLAALGRRPNTDGVNLNEAGVELDERGYVRVDEHLRTTAENTYAVGDVNGGPQFTHVSFDDHRVVKSALQDGAARSTTGRVVPYVVFLDPELGRVGLTEREARGRGHDVRVATMPAKAVPRARTLNVTDGLLKAVIERDTGRILGAAVLAANGGEVMTALQMAMLGGLTAGQVRDAVIAHPTMAEGLNTLLAG